MGKTKKLLEYMQDFPEIIESPLADGSACLLYDSKRDVFYYRCLVTGMEFTTTAVGDRNVRHHPINKLKGEDK